MFRDRRGCLARRTRLHGKRAAAASQRSASARLLARARLAAAAGRAQGHGDETHARAREVLPGHAAQLPGLRAGSVRSKPADRVHDLPGRQRLRRQRRPRPRCPGQPDRPAGRAADGRDLRRPGHHAGAERPGSESIRADLRVRLAHAAVLELPDRRARACGRRRLQPLEGSKRSRDRRNQHRRRRCVRRGVEPAGSISPRHHLGRQLRQFQGRRSPAGPDSPDRAAAAFACSCRPAGRIW